MSPGGLYPEKPDSSRRAGERSVFKDATSKNLLQFLYLKLLRTSTQPFVVGGSLKSSGAISLLKQQNKKKSLQSLKTFLT